MFDAFAAPGRFWRGNLHGHSNRSDGLLTPEEVCRRYAAAGYDFTCVTDHFIGFFKYPIVDTAPFRTATFTTLFGAELHSGATANGELWHIVAVGLPADFAPPDAPDFSVHEGMETGAEIARRARDAGAFVIIAHPEWYGLTEKDARSVDAAHAVEIYNHASAAFVDRGDGLYLAEQLLNAGRDVTLVAADDSHFHIPDQFGGWVMVKATENTPEALLAALKAGHFYASQGPEIHNVELTGDGIRVQSSPVERVIIHGQGSTAGARMGDGMTDETIPLYQCKRSPWLRVTVIDSQGRRAWSNPQRGDWG